MKANFKISKSVEEKTVSKDNEDSKNLTRSEFEDFIIKSGARGSFMVYRSNKKEDELGLKRL